MYTFGELLRQFRVRQDMEQHELADQLKVHRNTIIAWEHGENLPRTRNKVLDLAKILYLDEEDTNQLLFAADYPLQYQSKETEKAPLTRIKGAQVGQMFVEHLEVAGFITDSASIRCDFYAHISLPPNYIKRSVVLEHIQATLLSDTSSIALTLRVKLKPLALHGKGGIGKSVIARALCEDSTIQAAFPDGILWLSLGKAPDLVPAMRSWINALGGIVRENAPTVPTLQNILAALLRERSCLLILDDVWHYTHAQKFLIDSPRSRLLLTTRDDIIARELGAIVQRLPLMTNEEAIALLEQWADGHLPETTPELKMQIVERLGWLPLAVKLAGAQLQWKSADIWLQTFDVRTLESPRLETHHDSLERTIRLSLDELKERDLRLYIHLAIFRENDLISEAAIGYLWQGLDGLDRYATEYLLKDLASRALIDIVSDPFSHTPAVRIHNLLHNLIRIEMGENSTAAHQILLTIYRTKQKGIGWHTAPNDGYLYDHLAYHLQEAAYVEEIQGLFANQYWMSARVPQCHDIYDGYLEDLSLAWKSADDTTREQIKENKEPLAFAQCMRYLLIQASINSIATNYTPELVARAVKIGLWSLSQALSIAAKISSPWKQAYMYIALLQKGHLSETQQEDVSLLALRSTLSIVNKNTDLYDQLRGIGQCEALAMLAPYLKGDLLERGLEAVLALIDKNMGLHDQSRGMGQCEALAMLAPYLKGDLLERGLEAALALPDDSQRLLVLTGLAPNLTEEQIERVWEVTVKLPDRLRHSLTLSTFASYIAEKRRTELVEIELEAAFAVTDRLRRAYILTSLVSFLPLEQRTQMLKQELDVTFTLTDEQEQVQILVALAPLLTDKLLERALNATLAFSNEWHRMQVLTALVPQMTGELLEQALQIALAIKNEMERARALKALAPKLTGQLVEQALQSLLAVRLFHVDRVEAIAELAPRIPSTQRFQVLQQELTFAQSLTFEFAQAQLLAILAPHLPDEQLEQALESVLALTNEYEREWLLPLFAPRLTGKLLARALTHTSILTHEWRRIKFLAMIAGQLPVEQRTHILKQEVDAMLTLAHKRGRVHLLAVLLPLLSAEQRDVIVKQELDAAISLTDEDLCAQALAALASLLSTEQKTQVLDSVTKLLQEEQDQAHVLAALAPYLSAEQQTQLLGIALNFTSETPQVSVLVSLMPCLEGAQFEQGLEATLALTYDIDRMRTVRVLAPRLSVKQRFQVLKQELPALQTQTSIAGLENALISLACLIPQEVHQQWLEIATTIVIEQQRGQVLVALAPQLTGKLVEQALEATLVLEDEEQRGRVLVALASQLTEQLMEEALKAALALTNARIRAYTLTAFLPLASRQNQLRQTVQLALVDYLLYMKHWSRDDIFNDELIKELFRRFLLPPEVTRDVTLHIIEICQEWYW